MKNFFFWKSAKQKAAPDSPNLAAGPSGFLTGDASQDEESLQILLESIAQVSANIDPDQVLRDIADRSLQITQADRAILLLGSDPSRLSIRTVRNRAGEDLEGDVDYSHSVVARSIRERRAGQYRVHSKEEALELSQSVYNLKLRTVMCAPLIANNRLVGVIYVDSKAARRDFSSRDLALFDALSSQLAIALENARLHADSLQKARLEKDVEIARRIQKHLLPPVPQDIPGLEIALHFVAASQASGDTYDFLTLDQDRVAILIGDVTGHGVGAALLTHAAQAAVRSYLELVPDLGELVGRLNNRLVQGVEAGIFMSVILLVLDRRQKTLHYVNAGHPPLLLVQEGSSIEFEKTGMVLGVAEDQVYEVKGPIQLNQGDLCFLRTDGVEETMSIGREIYGVPRLREYLVQHRDQSAEEILSGLDDDLRLHSGGQDQEDDVTMIAIKVS